MKSNKRSAFSRFFVFWVIFLFVGSGWAQDNTNTANSRGNTINRNTAAANSNKTGNSNLNNQNTQTANTAGNATNTANSNQNAAGQTDNSNSSNSNTASQTDQTNQSYKLKYGDFEISGFPLWFNIVILLGLAVGLVYITFWHVPNKIANMSGATIMKISIAFLIVIVLVMAAFYGFSARSTTAQDTPAANTASQNTTNSAAANNSTVNNQSGQPANTVTNSTVQNNKPEQTPTPTQTPTQTPTPVKGADTPTVEKVYRLGYANNMEEGGQAGIRDIIVVEVKNLKKLVDRSLCRDDKGERVADCENQKISLFLDGRKINSIEPEAINLNGNDGTLQFHLTRSAGSNDEAWADLLGDPDVGNENFFYRKDTKVSVGLENEYALAQPKPFNIIRIREWRFWIFSILYLFLLFLIYRLAVKSDILRDVGEQPEGSSSPEGFGIRSAFAFGKSDKKRKPYSLARFQMAFWFLLVIGSFFYIYLITGALDIITTEILALIGIGAGTALGAAAIDVGKRDTAGADVSAKEEEKAKLEAEIADLETRINASPPTDLTELKAKKDKVAELEDEIKRFKAGLRPASEGFLKDVLTDATGVSFHRFQIFIWTLVLGIIFVTSVWTRLSMPEFGATLLALLGISAGTYLGFKIPENQNADG